MRTWWNICLTSLLIAKAYSRNLVSALIIGINWSGPLSNIEFRETSSTFAAASQTSLLFIGILFLLVTMKDGKKKPNAVPILIKFLSCGFPSMSKLQQFPNVIVRLMVTNRGNRTPVNNPSQLGSCCYWLFFISRANLPFRQISGVL